MAKAKDGWYVLQRSIVDGPVWNCEDPFGKRSAYIDLLLMANYEDKVLLPRHNNSVITIHKGETLTSYEHLARRWKWSRKKVIAYLNQLEMAGILKRKSYSFGTVLTLVEYSESGKRGTANDTTSDTTNDTAEDTSVGTTNDTTNDTAKGTRHKEIKEVKESKRNGKEEKEIKESAKRSGGFVWEGDPE